MTLNKRKAHQKVRENEKRECIFEYKGLDRRRGMWYNLKAWYEWTYSNVRTSPTVRFNEGTAIPSFFFSQLRLIRFAAKRSHGNTTGTLSTD